ncbi:MAG: carboxypeptidase regulatory-like domain-containing protein [Euryarchaeota archaeon]|nr:carboxypeptidase regulatory-like domain-containing protein [Euryarchaeota archaeon]
MQRALAIIALFVTAALSGCASRDASQTGPIAPAYEDETGNVEGVVVNSELEPVMGAQLAIDVASVDPATTDDAGRFSFLGVPAGKHKVYVNALGYEAEARSVEVVVGETSEVKFELRLLSTTDPFSVVQSRKGFIACGSGTGTSTTGGLTQVGCGAADPNQAFLFNYTFAKGLSGILFEMKWTPSQVLSRDLVLIVEKDGCDLYCEVGDTFAEVQGCCYLRVGLPVANLTKGDAYKPATDFEEKSGRIQSRTFPAFTDENAASVFISQDFRIYVEYFYNGLPSDFDARTNVPS